MRKTQKELKGVVERFNASIEPSGYFIKVGHRNGYTAIDLHRLSDGGMLNNMDAGLTDKQALNTLYNMCKAVELLHNPIK